MKRIEWIIFFLIFGFSMLLRIWKYEQIPYQTDGDEMAYVFAGQSLVDFGEPISWSSFTYPQKQVYRHVVVGNKDLYSSGEYTLVRPWFDHPYLLPIIQGWTSQLFGYHFYSVPPSLIIRLPMLLLVAATLALTFAISRHLFGTTGGYFSLALMGFTPSLSFGQRMVVGDNLFIPLMLAALYCVLKKKHAIFPILFLGTAALSKITGLIAFPIALLPLVVVGEYKRAIKIACGGLLLFIGLLLFYGGFHGWTQFIIMITSQTYRLVGWSNPAFILSHPGFQNKAILDAGYYLILMFGIFPLLKEQKKQHRWIPIAVLLTGTLVWVTGAEQDMLGWYKLSFFTMLSISSGLMLEGGISSFASVLIWIAGINNIGLVRYPLHPLPSTETLRFVVGALLISTYVLQIIPSTIEKKIKHALLIGGFVFYGGVSLYTMHNYFQASCESRNCPSPEMTMGMGLKNMVKWVFQAR